MPNITLPHTKPGQVRATPVKNNTALGFVELPAPLQVTSIGTIPLEPTNEQWCWKLETTIYGEYTNTEFVTVAKTDTEYRELIRVDPGSFTPSPYQPETAWWAALRTGLKAAEGEPGKKGDPGEDGEDGKDGFSNAEAEFLITRANEAAIRSASEANDAKATAANIRDNITSETDAAVKRVDIPKTIAEIVGSQPTVVAAAAAAVDANPKISSLQNNQWRKPLDAATTDLNLYITPGIREVTRSGVANRPVGASGNVEVLPIIGTNVIQRWTTTEAAPRVYIRTSPDMGSTWANWYPLSWRGGGAGANADANLLTVPGIYEISNTTTKNMPTAGVASLEVLPIGTGYVIQRATTVDEPPRIYTRVIRIASGEFTAWKKTPTQTDLDNINKRIDDISDKPVADNKTVRSALGEWSPTDTRVKWDEYICTLSEDRLKGWNGQDLAGDLMETRDEGKTWTLIKNFGEYLVWVRELDNGELLVGTGGVSPNPRSIWVSNNYPALGDKSTWTKTLTAAAPGVTFGTSWGYSQYKNIVLLAEYGPKYNTGNEINSGENARYAYLSLDNGKTWKNIFDLNTWVEKTHGTGKAINVHLHGITFDQYWDRIWVTYGDDVNGTCYSDDLGETWYAAHWSNETYSLDQNVGIIALPARILFGTDTAPNGVMAFDRTEGKKNGLYTLKQAYTIPGDDGTTRTHLCQAIHRVPQIGGTDVYLFGFGAETNPGKSTIAATRDGFTWKTLWQDPLAQTPGKGLRTIAGPTLTGKLIVGSDDKRDPSLWTQWKGSVPIY